MGRKSKTSITKAGKAQHGYFLCALGAPAGKHLGRKSQNAKRQWQDLLFKPDPQPWLSIDSLTRTGRGCITRPASGSPGVTSRDS